MKSLAQSINESMILELSSQLLGRAAKTAKEKGRNVQAAKFAVAAGKALERELKNWKPGPDAKNCGKAVAVLKDLSQSNSDMKTLAKVDPVSTTFNFPVLKKNGNEYDFEKWRKVTIPKGKFYVYKDEYHGNLHIASLSDIMGMIACAYWDFEDFDASYIVKTFDNLKDAAKYAEKVGTDHFYDSKDFIEQAKNGEIDEDEVTWYGPGTTILNVMLEFADVNGLPDDYREIGKTE